MGSLHGVQDKKSIKEIAKAETLAEMQKEAVGKYKEKLKELHAAKQVMKGIERELADLEEELNQECADIEDNTFIVNE